MNFILEKMWYYDFDSIVYFSKMYQRDRGQVSMSRRIVGVYMDFCMYAHCNE